MSFCMIGGHGGCHWGCGDSDWGDGGHGGYCHDGGHGGDDGSGYGGHWGGGDGGSGDCCHDGGHGGGHWD